MRKFTADLETTTDPDDCRVWAWGLCEIGKPENFFYGTDLTQLFDRFEKSSVDLYFHNLKFDGEFILHWLYTHNYEYREYNDMCSQSFNTLISDKGQWYAIRICQKMTSRRPVYITIYDSLKILPYSVSQVAKSFKLEDQKLVIDYTAKRPVGHVLTQQEKDYLRNDVTIVAKALDILFKQGMDRMTAGSNALKNFKEIFTERQFEYTFPPPAYDEDIRQSYRGGFCHLMRPYRNQSVLEGIVLDVNSLYPSVMYNNPLPYGEGVWFEGEYQENKLYPLYVQMMSFQFELKPNHVPTIQIKKRQEDMWFDPTEYLETSENIEVTMCLTSVDLELIREHYDLYNVTYHSGWMFMAATGLFRDYIDKWTQVKIQSKEEGNHGMYVLAKLMLNSLYGKFALNPNVRSKVPSWNEGTGMVDLNLGAPEVRNPLYIPVGSFITAWARDKTIRAAQKVYDRFIYADTDSLYLTGKDIPEELDIHPTKLGAWDHELTFELAHFVRQKTNIKLVKNGSDYKMLVTCAGMPERCYDTRPRDPETGEPLPRKDLPRGVNDHVDFDNFRLGARFAGKLQPRRVPGGVVLRESIFTIQAESFFSDMI